MSKEDAPLDSVLPTYLRTCETGDVAAIRRALDDNSALLNAEDAQGWTGIIMAAKHGHVQAVRFLVHERGARVDPARRMTHTALRGATLGGHLDVVRELLEAGADVNAPSDGMRTPLMGAARNGFLDIVRVLLNAGADVTAVNSFGETAIDVARDQGHHAIVQELHDQQQRGEKQSQQS